MSRAFWGLVYYTLRYGTWIALVVISADLLAMLVFRSWPGIETRLLTVGSYSVAAAIAVVRVA